MKKSLSDILRNNVDSVKSTWDSSEAANEFAPIPRGAYQADVIAGELCSSGQGTPGYKMTFEIVEGEYHGRRLWHDIWLTPAAIPMAKRDLAKIGVTSLEQLDQPLPAVFACRVTVSLQKGDDGIAYNRVRSFEVLSTKAHARDVFDEPDDKDAAREGNDQ